MTDRWLGVRVRQVDPHLAPLVSEFLMEMGGRAVLEEGSDLTTYLLPSPDPRTQIARLDRWLAELVGASGPAPVHEIGPGQRDARGASERQDAQWP